MTSSDDLNETTKNFIAAIESYVPEQPVVHVFKAIYDPETMLVIGREMYETDKPYVAVSIKEYEAIPQGKYKVEDGKMVKIQRLPPKKLQLVPGNTWHTVEGNMLIMGNDRGWDARNNH